ncbi:MAG TPA: hypothetical protein VEL07_17175 [Planctomycetota bacterium]|nr:hypothetical protein [Planctomycetota bacterium]
MTIARGTLLGRILRAAVLGLAVAVASTAEPLLPNGDFATADPEEARKPVAWQFPDGVGAAWLDAPGGGKGIRLDTRVSEVAMNDAWNAIGLEDFLIPKPATTAMAEFYGLSYYSDPVVIEAGRSYRLSYEFQGPAAGVKVWLRGYGELKRADGSVEQRKLWESVVAGVGDGEGWHAVEHTTNPTKHRPAVRTVRVMLYAYWPATVYWFRNVRLEAVAE